MQRTLRVRSVPGRLHPDFAAQDAGVHRYVGHRFDPKLGDMGGFVAIDQAVDVVTVFKASDGRTTNATQDYLNAIRVGDLLAGDEATATLAGTRFTAPKVNKS